MRNVTLRSGPTWADFRVLQGLLFCLVRVLRCNSCRHLLLGKSCQRQVSVASCAEGSKCCEDRCKNKTKANSTNIVYISRKAIWLNHGYLWQPPSCVAYHACTINCSYIFILLHHIYLARLCLNIDAKMLCPSRFICWIRSGWLATPYEEK